MSKFMKNVPTNPPLPYSQLCLSQIHWDRGNSLEFDLEIIFIYKCGVKNNILKN